MTIVRSYLSKLNKHFYRLNLLIVNSYIILGDGSEGHRLLDINTVSARSIRVGRGFVIERSIIIAIANNCQ